MAYIVRQSTEISAFPLGPFLDSADGNTVEDGLTITQPDIRLSKNGGAFAQKSASQTLSHMENGYYSLALSTTDTNTVGTLRVHCHESGALPVWVDFMVVEEAIYDALFAASATGLLPANVTQFGGSNGTFASGRPEVNTTHAAGTAWGSGAITSGALHSGAVTAIQSGLATSSALATVDNNVDDIKAKTDQLTFGVTNTLNANITYVNEVEVGGAGTEGDPWSPA